MERKSAGLRARRMTEADLEPLHRLLSDPEVMRYLEPPFSREQTRAFLERAGLTPEPLILAVDDGGFAGYVIWHPYDDVSMELGWVLTAAAGAGDTRGADPAADGPRPASGSGRGH